MENKMPILEVKEINKYFPGVHALKDVDFNLCKGEIHGLVGHNGAGKSTLVKVLTGNYVPCSGEIYLDGKIVDFQKPKDAIDVGIGIVTQEGTLISSFTGIENIFLGHEKCKAGMIKETYLKEEGERLLTKIGLDTIDLSIHVDELSPAQRKIVEILKIITLDPKIVIFDESTAALSDKERLLLFDIMKQFKQRDIGIVFITHYIEEVLNICDRTTVMRDGAVVGTVSSENATKDAIVMMMINKEQKSVFPEYDRNPGEILMDIENFSDGHSVKDASLTIRKGEVVGLFGTVGSGRTELGELIFGARKKLTGTIKKNNKEIKIKNVKDAIKEGMALVPDDRLTKALMLDEPITDNITLPFLDEYTKSFVVNRKAECQDAEKIVDFLDIKTPSIYTKVKNLSGGNKQKISFAKWITGNEGKSDFYIFDEPTEGVDIGACAEMYKIIVDLIEKQCGCLVISSDISEIMGLSDRIFIMREGSIVGEFNRDEKDLQKKLVSTSLGF